VHDVGLLLRLLAPALVLIRRLVRALLQQLLEKRLILERRHRVRVQVGYLEDAVEEALAWHDAPVVTRVVSLVVALRAARPRA
jgi:hypothetical protein